MAMLKYFWPLCKIYYNMYKRRDFLKTGLLGSTSIFLEGFTPTTTKYQGIVEGYFTLPTFLKNVYKPINFDDFFVKMSIKINVYDYDALILGESHGRDAERKAAIKILNNIENKKIIFVEEGHDPEKGVRKRGILTDDEEYRNDLPQNLEHIILENGNYFEEDFLDFIKDKEKSLDKLFVVYCGDMHTSQDVRMLMKHSTQYAMQMDVSSYIEKAIKKEIIYSNDKKIHNTFNNLNKKSFVVSLLDMKYIYDKIQKEFSMYINRCLKRKEDMDEINGKIYYFNKLWLDCYSALNGQNEMFICLANDVYLAALNNKIERKAKIVDGFKILANNKIMREKLEDKKFMVNSEEVSENVQKFYFSEPDAEGCNLLVDVDLEKEEIINFDGS